ncbi:hypothetical protein [Rathayibacter toxicus]|nr:hypothetical protein [Rathayibacter toxicus]
MALFGGVFDRFASLVAVDEDAAAASMTSSVIAFRWLILGTRLL